MLEDHAGRNVDVEARSQEAKGRTGGQSEGAWNIQILLQCKDVRRKGPIMSFTRSSARDRRFDARPVLSHSTSRDGVRSALAAPSMLYETLRITAGPKADNDTTSLLIKRHSSMDAQSSLAIHSWTTVSIFAANLSWFGSLQVRVHRHIYNLIAATQDSALLRASALALD